LCTTITHSNFSFKKIVCLTNFRVQDLLSHEPTLWFQLWVINRTIFQLHKVSQSLLKLPLDLKVELVPTYTLRYECHLASLTVQFQTQTHLYDALRLSIFFCALRWRLNVSVRSRSKKARDQPEGFHADATQFSGVFSDRERLFKLSTRSSAAHHHHSDCPFRCVAFFPHITPVIMDWGLFF